MPDITPSVENSGSQRPRRIGIIGGGISGLAAAFRLGELSPETEVSLFEAAGRLGGVLYTERRDGFLIEHCADNFITNNPWATDFCRRLGFAEQLLTTNLGRQAFVVHQGRLRPVPDGFMLLSPRRMWPILTSSILSWKGKLRLAWEKFVPPRTEPGDESLASFARRRLGDEAFERLVQPLIAGIYTADPEKLSLEATMPRFLEMERKWGSLINAAWHEHEGDDGNSAGSGARYSLFVTPRDGMSSLIEAIAKRLPEGSVHLNSPVESIARLDCRWQLRFKPSGNQPPREAVQCDGLILAAPAPVTGRLLQTVDAALASDVASIPLASTAIVVTAYKRGQLPHGTAGFGFVVPAIEGRKIIACSFSSAKFPDRAPQDCVLMRVFVGGAQQPELLKLDDAAIKQIVRHELASLLGVTGEPVLETVVRWDNAMPQYHLGHTPLVDRIEAAARAIPNFALAGNAYRGVGIPHCIHSGEQAAAHVLGRSPASR